MAICLPIPLEAPTTRATGFTSWDILIMLLLVMMMLMMMLMVVVVMITMTASGGV